MMQSRTSLLIATVLGLASPAAAVTWLVDVAGGGDYTAIQDAVDAASDGDVIEIAPGTYIDDDEDGVVVSLGVTNTLDLTIRATAPGVTIDGQDAAQGLACWSGDVVIEGIDFVDCATTSQDGGGVLARNAGESITISSCTFTNCSDQQSFGKGGAICLDSAVSSQPITFSLADTTMFGCSSTSYGGCMFVDNASGTISNCTFEDGWASNGGAMEVRSGVATISGSIFTGNIASNGGAMRLYDVESDVTVTSSQFRMNDASFGSAAQVAKGLLTLVSCDVEDNVATRSGAVYIRSDGTVDVSYSIFSLNEATESGYDTWHAISGDADAALSVADSTFCDHPSSGEIEMAYTDGGGNDLGDWCCPGDVDQDGDVDGGDIALFLSAYGSALITADDRVDVSRDDDADVEDLLGLLTNWGVCG
ncbi:MAG: right-handed parallel beta-helix repeat-containing protein [Phycisphaerales bacterium]|jgi:hypothetical protein|nr:right-handed parallel beta-helix repeat-containing protein [Phycisphaerales bacterium]